MTVIATLITDVYTVHATDSFLTTMAVDGSRDIIEEQQTKIIPVPAFRGALAYYGLACMASSSNDWSTLEWLRGRARDAAKYQSAEEFARGLARSLSSELNRLRFQSPADKILGIHFTAYERLADYWIPELFHIRNWAGDSLYSTLSPTGFVCTRETYGTLKGIPDRPDSHRESACRMAVQQALDSQHVLFRFNNGDPVLFNPIADAVLGAVQELIQHRQSRRPHDAHFHLSLARRPVEIVSRLLTEFAEKGMRRIGGKPHDLAIAPDGQMTSTTGDA